jgi:hypothetical protein
MMALKKPVGGTGLDDASESSPYVFVLRAAPALLLQRVVSETR